MRSTTRCALAFLSIGVIGLPIIAAAQAPQFKPGDRVVVVPESADLKVGPEVVAKLSKGQHLTVSQVQGKWVWCLLEVDGQKKKGWIQAFLLTKVTAIEERPTSPSLPIYLQKNPTWPGIEVRDLRSVGGVVLGTPDPSKFEKAQATIRASELEDLLRRASESGGLSGQSFSEDTSGVARRFYYRVRFSDSTLAPSLSAEIRSRFRLNGPTELNIIHELPRKAGDSTQLDINNIINSIIIDENGRLYIDVSPAS